MLLFIIKIDDCALLSSLSPSFLFIIFPRKKSKLHHHLMVQSLQICRCSFLFKNHEKLNKQWWFFYSLSLNLMNYSSSYLWASCWWISFVYKVMLLEIMIMHEMMMKLQNFGADWILQLSDLRQIEIPVKFPVQY